MGRVARGIAQVAGGTAGAQAVTFAASLVVARLVAPHAYGEFASLTAAASVLGSVAPLRLELAIPVPAADDDADTVVRAAFTSTLAVACATAIVLVAAHDTIAGVLGLPAHDAGLLAFVPPIVLGIGVYATLTQRVLRDRRYHRIAVQSLAQAAVTAVAQVALVAVSPTPATLLVGLLVGQVCGIVLLAGPGVPHRPARWSALRSVLGAYRSFPLFLAPSALVNTLGLQAPLLLGGALFGSAFAGWFGMAQRLVAVPVTVLGSAVGQVFLGEFSTLRRTDPTAARPAFARASRALLGVGLAGGVALAALAPTVIPWVLGPRYAAAGAYAQALCLSVVAQVVAAPLSTTLILTGHQSWQAAWDVARLVVTAAVFWAGAAMSAGPDRTLWAYGAASGALYAALWLASRTAVARAATTPGPPVPSPVGSLT